MSAFDYTITLRQLSVFLSQTLSSQVSTFTSVEAPDFSLFSAGLGKLPDKLLNSPEEDTEELRKQRQHYERLIGAAVIAMWRKVHHEMQRYKAAQKTLPKPLKMRELKGEKKVIRPLTAPEVAEFLNLHPDSVRRISKKILPYRKTKGGHRRYSEAQVKLYVQRLREDLSSD